MADQRKVPVRHYSLSFDVCDATVADSSLLAMLLGLQTQLNLRKSYGILGIHLMVENFCLSLLSMCLLSVIGAINSVVNG